MQAYNAAFARIYNQRWTGFAQRVAPQIWTFFESTSAAEHRSLLDLCCGTGQLALAFLERGYRVIGLDLSAHMLHYARENTAPYIEAGQASFVHGDASDFQIDERFGLVVSTFDALNHLPSAGALEDCFRCVHSVLLPGGFFVFDLNTRAGLRVRWNGIQVENTEEILLVTRGIYDEESAKAWTGITGFLRTESGLYERFEQVAYNTGFDLAWVRSALLETGWRSAYFARMEDLGMPVVEPESEHHVFIVAYK